MFRQQIRSTETETNDNRYIQKNVAEATNINDCMNNLQNHILDIPIASIHSPVFPKYISYLVECSNWHKQKFLKCANIRTFIILQHMKANYKYWYKELNSTVNKVKKFLWTKQ